MTEDLGGPSSRLIASSQLRKSPGSQIRLRLCPPSPALIVFRQSRLHLPAIPLEAEGVRFVVPAGDVAVLYSKFEAKVALRRGVRSAHRLSVTQRTRVIVSTFLRH
jgi:hypothetical protein